MSDEPYFTCPQCGGHHFGRDSDVCHCHNASDGSPYLGFEDWIKAGRPKQKLCGWQGMWPPEDVAEVEGLLKGEK